MICIKQIHDHNVRMTGYPRKARSRTHTLEQIMVSHQGTAVDQARAGVKDSTPRDVETVWRMPYRCHWHDCVLCPWTVSSAPQVRSAQHSVPNYNDELLCRAHVLLLTNLCVSWLSGSSNAWMVECPPACRVVASSEDRIVLVPAEGPAAQPNHTAVLSPSPSGAGGNCTQMRSALRYAIVSCSL